jgi:hypothetical protein
MKKYSNTMNRVNVVIAGAIKEPAFVKYLIDE